MTEAIALGRDPERRPAAIRRFVDARFDHVVLGGHRTRPARVFEVLARRVVAANAAGGMTDRARSVLRFDDKEAARRAVWDRLQAERIARFPFPPHGRIPNFAGAHEAAQRLFDHPLLKNARRIKVNPDAPQRPVREEALRRGIIVYVPTPRLRGGFRCLDPARIPKARIAEAASLSRGKKWGRAVALDELPQMDVIVAGSVAVTRDGRRAGKGEGYSDLEYAILRELGHAAAPVVTTVHQAQIVDRLPRSANDVPIRLIVTPRETIAVRRPPRGPRGMDWALLEAERLREMPVLQELRARIARSRHG